MENIIGYNVKTYKDVTIRNCQIGDNTSVADNTFMCGCKIGQSVIIERRNFLYNCNIGNYTWTGFNDVIRECTIGKYCSLSWNVSVGGANHNMSALTMSFFPFDKSLGFVDENSEDGFRKAYNGTCIVGNDVWLSAGTMILRGVSVGDGAVVGGGGIVTKDVPPYEIWAGVPAKKIGQRFSDEIISELMELKWWNFPKDIIKKYIELFRRDVTPSLIKEIKEIYENSDGGRVIKE